MRKILLVDGLNMFIRNFVVNPSADANGESIGGIVGFIRSVKMSIREWEPDLVIVVWDGEGGSRRRRGVYSEYKAGRKVRTNRAHDFEGVDDQWGNMDSQLAKLKGLISQMGVLQVERDDVEADDLIAYLSRLVFSDDQKLIVTSDRDMLQLVDSSTVVYSPTKKIYWTSDEIREKIGVLPGNYIYIKVLCGDSSDNIKGVGGVGEKTALKLFPFLSTRQATLQDIFAHAEANAGSSPKYRCVVEQRDRLAENYKLMQLSSTILSPQSASIVREAVQKKPEFQPIFLKVEMSRQGIQIDDKDFDSTFLAYRRRTER